MRSMLDAYGDGLINIPGIVSVLATLISSDEAVLICLLKPEYSGNV